ncbi:MAG TPA: helix-turn-helix domain-containing protein [Candidatus Merdivicinus excrementipullorum]|uniref:Helix-turn-helix domain-containing protein n=1 Tax=Candidatus Merdivicinus excrementipullorum TaxID=2840867 RepID=A0A9D1JZ48_9FIRM|nr:helix-turn-helix domain-containing protein [Candidatus Merdivicinus excrementipullorum]
MEPLLIELHYMAYNRFCENWQVEPRALADYELIYILSGNGVIAAGGKSRPFEAGSFILIPPGLTHAFRSRELPLSLWCSHFSAFAQVTGTPASHRTDTENTLISGLFFPNWESSPSSFHYRPAPIQTELVFQPKNQISRVLAQKIGQLMQENIAENVSHIRRLLEGILKDNTGPMEKKQAPVAVRMKEYLEMHYAEKITLSQLSEVFYRDPSYLSALFKKNTGVTITEYLCRCRINAAKAYLSYTDETLESIADKTGFFDSPHLCRTFFRKEGMSPNQYRILAYGNQI